jgi:hypothetical protein
VATVTAPTLWPAPGDTATVSARKVARIYRTHLHTTSRTACDEIDRAMVAIGQRWVVPKIVTYDTETLVTVIDAAVIAGVQEETVRQWRNRGYIDRTGTRAHLQVRGLSPGGAMMFMVGELLEVAAITRSRRKSP